MWGQPPRLSGRGKLDSVVPQKERDLCRKALALSRGLRGFRQALGGDGVKLARIAQRREPPSPEPDDDQRANASENHCVHGPEPLRGDAGLELPKFVRRSNENHIDGRHSTAHLVGSCKLGECGSNDDADHVAGAQQEQCNQR